MRWPRGLHWRRPLRRLNPARSLLFGFSAITALGAFLLALPIASANGASQPWIDALFTATSAVTTTGLGVVDTGSYYSLFGQLVVLFLLQVGGLGYMVFIALLALVMGRRITLRAGAALEQSLAGFSLGELREFVVLVFLYTGVFELLGAAALSAYWMGEFSLPRAIYLGVFHSASAFCTAGFSLFSDSFMSYSDSDYVNVVIAVVTIAGAVGFFVLRDLLRYLAMAVRREHPRRLSVHTKLVLTVSIGLVAWATVLLMLAEPATSLGATFGDRLRAATFQTISASTTTGFNSIDIGSMSVTGLFAIVLLMFVGASPGGTGGGIKTTTLATVFLTARALISGSSDTQAFWRRIPDETVRSALTIGLLATSVTVLGTLVLTLTESQDFFRLLFEVVSALGTVGLSTGITASLTTAGKAVVCVIMLVGRLGPLAVGFALLARAAEPPLRYAREDVFVG